MADVAITEVNKTAPAVPAISVPPPAETVRSSTEAPFPGPDEPMTGANVTQRAPSEADRMPTPLSDGPGGSGAHLIRTEQPERTALPSGLNKLKRRNSPGGGKGVLIGHWRDSPVPELENKHAVIGSLDVYDRLRTRIRPFNKDGETLSDYPLPPGSGGCWVTFDRIYFLDHLVGLDQFQVKEYIRLRAAASEETEEERLAKEAESVKLATIKGRELLQTENPRAAPLIAHGAIPNDASSAAASNSKRRKTSSSFVSIASQDDAAAEAAATASQHLLVHDLLQGTRPTKIVIGYWRGSNEALELDRHAVWGILGQNDMFRFKLVRETRDGRAVEGNFPSGAGGIWILQNDIKFEPHIQNFSRPEIKEYCRIRQYQVDHGEEVEERPANELLAAEVARIRARAFLPTHHLQGAPQYGKAYPHRDAEGTNGGTGATDSPNVGRASVDHEPRQQLRRAKSKADLRGLRSALAADAGASIVGSVTVPSPPITNGAGARLPVRESEDIECWDYIWEHQESLPPWAGLEDAKIYDGVKYERKPTGAFMGKLVSQGTIITIDGEEYVEYRVLTKPSFF
ncbi:hypothetical protein BBO_08297 [Beauveria brongniartii RCEF 3172]|uniref:Uncharacterized protein n=1 Tax=Beauveria brongniartii RCEF 3172 TaxID=1081107 RepID=A0A166S4N1_9HYPO|nr:hypothetical protein BBO_08297 [Beauveria brongniartii RCEF 3172]